MNHNQKIYQKYRECAGKGCLSPGIHQMTVLYLEKSGWFCTTCKNKLKVEGLIVENSKQVWGLDVSQSTTPSNQTSIATYTSAIESEDLKR